MMTEWPRLGENAETVVVCVLSQDMQRLPEAVQHIEKASVMNVENGTPDTAAMALDRAGKCVLHNPAYTVAYSGRECSGLQITSYAI